MTLCDRGRRKVSLERSILVGCHREFAAGCEAGLRDPLDPASQQWIKTRSKNRAQGALQYSRRGASSKAARVGPSRVEKGASKGGDNSNTDEGVGHRSAVPGGNKVCSIGAGFGNRGTSGGTGHDTLNVDKAQSAMVLREWMTGRDKPYPLPHLEMPRKGSRLEKLRRLYILVWPFFHLLC
jgi:hypothetical protein